MVILCAVCVKMVKPKEEFDCYICPYCNNTIGEIPKEKKKTNS